MLDHTQDKYSSVKWDEKEGFAVEKNDLYFFIYLYILIIYYSGFLSI